MADGKLVSSSQDNIHASSLLLIPTLGLFKSRREGGGSCETSEYKTLSVFYNFSPNQLQFVPTFNAVFKNLLAAIESFYNILLTFHRNSSSLFPLTLYQFMKNLGKLCNYTKKYIC